MRPTKFRFIWLSGCREGDILVIDQPDTRIVYGGHFCEPIRMKWAIFIEDLPQIFPIKFRFICISGFRGEYLFKINQPET